MFNHSEMHLLSKVPLSLVVDKLNVKLCSEALESSRLVNLELITHCTMSSLLSPPIPFGLQEFDLARSLIWMESYSTQPLATGLSCSAHSPPGQTILFSYANYFVPFRAAWQSPVCLYHFRFSLSPFQWHLASLWPSQGIWLRKLLKYI